MHAIAAIAACFTDVPFLARLVVIALIISSLIFYLARDLFGIFPGSWQILTLERDVVSVLTRAGETFYGEVDKSTVVLPYLIVLRIKVGEGSWRVSRVLFPDALGSGEFRDLRVRLNYS
jgi:hypothetical protein